MGQPLRDEHGELEMSDDLVDQLKCFSLENYNHYTMWQRDMCNRAAAEIERLRSSLEKIGAISSSLSIQMARRIDDPQLKALSNALQDVLGQLKSEAA
jgi:hypothetical protein